MPEAAPLHLPGQPEAERLLASALAAPGHAYCLYGPPGSGKDAAALAFIARLLAADLHRVEEETHPDLYVVEPEGEQILIEQIRALRADLHLRPFEAARRAYLLRGVERLGDEAANALLKSLEEPPPYAVFVLVCHDRARLLPTVESRCQLVRFRRLPAAAVREDIAARAILHDAELDAVVRAAGGDLELARRLVDHPSARARRERVLDLARDAAVDPAFDAADAAAEVLAGARTRGDEAEAEVAARREAMLERVGTGKGAQRERRRVERFHDDLAKRRRRRAETDELRAAMEAALALWRDVLVAAAGAEDAVVAVDRLDDLRRVGAQVGVPGAEAAVAAVRAALTTLEVPVIPSLALEGMFHAIRLAQAPSAFATS